MKTKLHPLLILAVSSAAFFLSGCGNKAKLPESPEGTIKTVAAELANKEAGILWEAMPASYQNDLTEVIHSFANTIDAEIYDKSFSVISKLVQVLDQKQEFILNHQMVSQAGLKDAEQNWNSVVTALKTFAESDLSNLEQLKKLDIEHFLNTTGKSLLEQGEQVAKLSGEDAYAELRNLQVEVLESSATSAKLKLSGMGGDKTEELALTKVEERWVPTDLAQDWAKSMADSRKAIADMNSEGGVKNKPQIMGALAMLDSQFDIILQANTQEAFDNAIQQGIGAIFGMMMSMQQQQ